MISTILFQAESPSSGKFTAIGIYLLTCLFFVVAGFIEFAIVLQLQRYNDELMKPKFSMKDTTKSPTKLQSCNIKGTSFMNWEEHYNEEFQKTSKPNMNFEGCKLRLNKLPNPLDIKTMRMSPEDCKIQYEDGNTKKTSRRFMFNVRKIDIAAFGIVGILFVIFNIVYWITFLEVLGTSNYSETPINAQCNNSTEDCT